MKSRPRILHVPLVDVPFQEDFDIAETSRIDVHVQDIGTLIHELDKLELVVRGSKKRVHPTAASTSVGSTLVETSTTPVETASTLSSILPRTSLSLAPASTPSGTSTP
ncbi:hypothetical protein M9H77_27934 [Catharanthus roseus]|uniref:Uncharacterized protein n=1 Tax=Catharanthus roseus TaxID=4058 RepID=A0ACC0AEJ7_CATRO|nr:hypothetical protein M9H77_27934 [Catharanthus roseus]